MALSRKLVSPPDWLSFRLAALSRLSSVLIRQRLHLSLPGLSSILEAHPRSSERNRLSTSDLFERDGGVDWIVFEVEHTLFKVHRSLFLLKTRPSIRSEKGGIPLTFCEISSGTADCFRHFLHDLRSFPHELSNLRFDDSDVGHVMDRLLNITEMAIKHSLPVLEFHALKSIHHSILSRHLHCMSSAQLCRLLKIAFSSSRSQNLLADLPRRLIHTILRRKSALDTDFLSLIKTDPRFEKVEAVFYYRQLIDMDTEPRGTDAEEITQSCIDSDPTERARFAAAHKSLSTLFECLSTSAPLSPHTDYSLCHPCLLSWQDIWLSTVTASESSQPLSRTDVLGRLRHMQPLLKRLVSGTPTMCIDCGLAALEGVVALREDILDGLMGHFENADAIEN
ncbi:hypothetical protein R3P38DRAFT_2871195 [Favolaschia claudopus]|uniref:BTB domain-containing protein n=1 Tax=Favolaschia claudopus TaxID=2862362 RepID=A0AAW0DE72_9AGAR